MKKYKKITTFIFALVLVIFSVLPVLADNYGLDEAAKKGYSKTDIGQLPNQDIPTAIGKIIGAGLSFIGVIFLILMIYGGFLWMFARGNDQSVSKAKELITAAIIGLIIVMSAYAITSYVGSVLSK